MPLAQAKRIACAQQKLSSKPRLGDAASACSVPTCEKKEKEDLGCESGRACDRKVVLLNLSQEIHCCFLVKAF